MPRYLLHHRHEPHDCGVVFAAFKGYDSPLRHRRTLASCQSDTRPTHSIWWAVEAASADDALAQVPFYVAQRTVVTQVSDVQIP